MVTRPCAGTQVHRDQQSCPASAPITPGQDAAQGCHIDRPYWTLPRKLWEHSNKPSLPLVPCNSSAIPCTWPHRSPSVSKAICLPHRSPSKGIQYLQVILMWLNNFHTVLWLYTMLKCNSWSIFLHKLRKTCYSFQVTFHELFSSYTWPRACVNVLNR